MWHCRHHQALRGTQERVAIVPRATVLDWLLLWSPTESCADPKLLNLGASFIYSCAVVVEFDICTNRRDLRMLLSRHKTIQGFRADGDFAYELACLSPSVDPIMSLSEYNISGSEFGSYHLHCIDARSLLDILN